MTKRGFAHLFTGSFLRWTVRLMLLLPAILLACLLILVGVLLVYSPGKATPFLDQKGTLLAGSISEKLHANINGVEQGMFVKGMDTTKPVLLFLHGGPAMPEHAISWKYARVLEKNFVVCWWEQRGSGLSYRADMPPETLTTEQLIADTLEVTNYLRNRFGQEKIYLMGHSWGSYLGIQAAARAPELYHAYIGVAQISQQFESEKLAYSYMLEQYQLAGNRKMVQRLAAIPLLELDTMPPAYRSLRDEAMHTLGVGTTHTMKSVITGIFLPVMQNPEYTLWEKINIWRGKWAGDSTNMWNQLLAKDVTAVVSQLEIPVYFLHGIYDYTVSYPLAKRYFEQLQAPRKGFYTFDQSAHSPLFEEPERLQLILQGDVLAGTNNLADIQ